MKAEQIKAAEALAVGQSKAAAAKLAGVSARTVRRWSADSVEFADLIAELRSDYVAEAAGLLSHAATTAVRMIHELTTEGEAEAIRLRAAQTVLAECLRFRDHTEMESRLRQLEIAVGIKSESKW